MSEQLLETYAVKELELPAGESIDLRETVEAVRQHGIVVYDVGEKSKELDQAIDGLLHKLKSETLSDGYGYPSQTQVYSKNAAKIWENIAGVKSGFRAVNSLVNVYYPDNPFPKHTDLDEKPTSDGTPEESLSFLYIASGSKDIYFYLDGFNGPPTTINQRPGMLYVFQGGGYIFPDGHEVRGLYHEVPSQGVTNSITFNWELLPYETK